MKRSRRLDERAIALQRRGEIGTYAPAIGQEAAQVGSAFAMAEEDWLVPSFREGQRSSHTVSNRISCSGTRWGWRRAPRFPAARARSHRRFQSAPSRSTPSASAGESLRDARTSRSPTSGTARPARATSTRRSTSRASTTPRPSSSVRTTATLSRRASPTRPPPRRSHRRPSRRVSRASASTATTSSASTAWRRRPSRRRETANRC